MEPWPICDDAVLRPFAESDADELHAAIEANRDHLSEWLPWAPRQGRAQTLEFLRTAQRQAAANDGLQLAIVERGRIVGSAGFHTIDWPRRFTSIGYWLARDAQGRGLATRAVRACVVHAFGEWRLERIEIRAAPENARSRAIPERLGFRELGVLRGVERVGDRWVDHVVYELQAADWPRPLSDRPDAP
ncbi:GNAT family N-acetyltransferase [Capillimicrobium parvum]|uniref:Ribosomal N-acetyltransferase YdaF n=1 Tax=Capillimicrobium parvum TaxID=2884022 RepID=A0A9E7C251_9ACTN|nr:GNAT family protein [Capillimicrobium parvum]UGS37093.1 Putative ribosomal N-acetyltransferase YdaF [Capillimicrobium parvum]